MGEREVRDFLLDLALKQATPAVLKMNLAGLQVPLQHHAAAARRGGRHPVAQGASDLA